MNGPDEVLFDNVFIGSVTAEPVDWRSVPDNTEDDDEQIETPPDVIKMLGFDPALEG